MQEVGKVVSTKKKYAKVRLQRHAGCANCNMCGLGKRQTHIDIELINEIGAEVDDLVEISMDNSKVVSVVTIVYIVPIILAAIGLLIAMKLGLAEIWQLVIALGALLISVLLIFLSDKYFKKRKLVPKIEKIIEKGAKTA